MTYIPTTWVDESLTGAERFDIKENGGAAFKDNMQIVLHAGLLSAPGTPIAAAAMNNIDAGIQEALAAVAPGLTGANVEIQSIVAVGSGNEFNFTSIPAGYHNLRLVGVLKGISTGGGYPVDNLVGQINGDTGANYDKYRFDAMPYPAWQTGNTALSMGAVVKSWPVDAGLVSIIDLYFPEYDAAVLKFCRERGVAVCTNNNPSSNGIEALNLWRSTAAITRIQVLGTFVPTISHLSLYGVAL